MTFNTPGTYPAPQGEGYCSPWNDARESSGRARRLSERPAVTASSVAARQSFAASPAGTSPAGTSPAASWLSSGEWLGGWLSAARAGFCYVTPDGVSDCARGERGSWKLGNPRDMLSFYEGGGGEGGGASEAASQERREWASSFRQRKACAFGQPPMIVNGSARAYSAECRRLAAALCIRRCEACRRCRAVSVSPAWGECSWFATCSLEHLSGDVPGFVSGFVKGTPACVAPAPAASAASASDAPQTSPEEYRYGRGPWTSFSAAAVHGQQVANGHGSGHGHGHGLQVSRVAAAGLRCDERYMAVVHCAGRTFLFSRRDHEPKEVCPTRSNR